VDRDGMTHGVPPPPSTAQKPNSLVPSMLFGGGCNIGIAEFQVLR